MSRPVASGSITYVCGNEFTFRDTSEKQCGGAVRTDNSNSTGTKTRFTCPHGSKKIKQPSALVALTLVAPRDLLRGQYDSVSGEFDEELMVL